MQVLNMMQFVVQIADTVKSANLWNLTSQIFVLLLVSHQWLQGIGTILS